MEVGEKERSRERRMERERKRKRKRQTEVLIACVMYSCSSHSAFCILQGHDHIFKMSSEFSVWFLTLP